jgi:hypothetical protein
MARWLNSDRGWALALMLIVAILLAGIPVVADAPLAGGPPTLTVNICHPLPGMNVSTTPCAAALRRIVRIPAHIDHDSGAVARFAPPRFDRLPDAPDPPPPRASI